MKLRIQYLYAFLLLNIVLLQCCIDKHSDQYTYTASLSDSNINIDGILDESVWNSSEKVALKINETGAGVSDSSIMTWVRTCYDKQYIYIAYECNDSDIRSEFSNRDDHLWESDAVEIFIDTDGTLNTYYEIQVSPKNILFDAHLEIPTKTDDDEIIAFDIKGIKTGVTVDGTLNMSDDIDRKWTVELAIPIESLIEEKASFDAGSWRINYFRMNLDSSGGQSELGWSPTFGDFHIPSKFGVLKFNN